MERRRVRILIRLNHCLGDVSLQVEGRGGGEGLT
jgi:hypothetical protein